MGTDVMHPQVLRKLAEVVARLLSVVVGILRGYGMYGTGLSLSTETVLSC